MEGKKTIRTSRQDYTAEISIQIPVVRAFEYVRSHVNEWWTNSFSGSSQNIGDVFKVLFGKTYVQFQIMEMVKNKRIVWLVTDSHLDWINNKKEWNGTRIVFEFSEQKGITRIHMSHIGLVPEVECYENCNAGWNFYIKESLYQLLTGGKGRPDMRKSSN